MADEKQSSFQLFPENLETQSPVPDIGSVP